MLESKARTDAVTVVAEIGENHAGNIDRAVEMVRLAGEAGANIAKFQSYRGQDVDPDDPEREWFTQVELSDDDHRALLEAAEGAGIGFLSAPFTLERARFLVEKLGQRALKVASSEMLNARLLNYLNGRVQTVYISTGLADVAEIREAVSHLDDVDEVVIMHCVTQYPLADEDANLRAIGVLAEEFPEHRIGFSDHTLGTLAPVLAVALGATVVEKHFTVDRSLPGTDHELSLLPDELAAMVRDIRRAELMLGEREKRPTTGELEIREFVRTRFPK
jgi:N,N'-diacetyllegionaminate synthase